MIMKYCGKIYINHNFKIINPKFSKNKMKNKVLYRDICYIAMENTYIIFYKLMTQY